MITLTTMHRDGLAAVTVLALSMALPYPATPQAGPGPEAGRPGLVRVDDGDIYIVCSGTQTDLPTVVFENGLGDDHSVWGPIRSAIAGHTRTCAYDRLGVGRSDPVAEGDTRTPFEQARTLRAVLRAANIETPIVLAGHSIAGLVLLAYPHLFPDEVAGLVFVDASHPTQWIRFREVNPDATDPIGASGAERVDRGEARRELAEVGTFGDLPVAVLHQARPSDSEIRPIWIELQNDHAARSRNARVIPATESGHYVQRDQPQLVIDAIRWVLGLPG